MKLNDWDVLRRAEGKGREGDREKNRYRSAERIDLVPIASRRNGKARRRTEKGKKEKLPLQ